MLFQKIVSFHLCHGPALTVTVAGLALVSMAQEL